MNDEKLAIAFQSTLPTKEVTAEVSIKLGEVAISIHTSNKGSDGK